MAGNTQDKRVNDQRLRSLRDGGTFTESMTGRGTGSILFKKVGAVTTAYYRWNLDRKGGQLSIGQYKSTPSSPGLTLAEIREKGRFYVDIFVEHGNPREYLARQHAANEAAAKETEAVKNLATFKDLLDNYSADLKARGKVKATQIARMFEMHVIEPFPLLAAKPAREITDGDIYEILTRVQESKPRNRGKNNSTQAPITSMRSTTDTLHRYMSAAFEKAKTHKYQLERKNIVNKNLDLKVNVAASVGGLENVYKGDTESLQQPELMELLLHLDSLPERQRAIALAPIYLGGQRLKMLLDLRWEHIDDEGILLFDKKGRDEPFPHFLPITPRIREILEPLFHLQMSEKGPFALTKNLAGSVYASKFYSLAGRKLSEAGKTRYFSWQEVRTTAETILAGLGISADARAHLLSHGRTGIQAKHYDRNAYLREKTEALEAWCTFLDNVKQGIFRPDIKIYRLSDIRPKPATPTK